MMSRDHTARTIAALRALDRHKARLLAEADRLFVIYLAMNAVGAAAMIAAAIWYGVGR